MPFLTPTCPECGETKGHHRLARAEYSPVAPQVLGGILWALVFVLSRKRRFRCGRCAREFFRHTTGSLVWRVVWIFFCVSLGLSLAIALLLALLR